MRISAGDEGSERVLRVTLDGEKVKNCVTADTDEGWADVYVPFDPRVYHADEWPIERKHGKVEIIWRDV